MISLTKRQQPSAVFAALAPFMALVLTLITGALIFWISDKPPLESLYLYFVEPLIEVWSLHELAIKAAPLILIGAGLAIAYRANVWNIGAEGQLLMGAIFGSMLPIFFPNAQGPWVLPVMLIMGALGGALFAAIPAFLKVRMNTNEILASLMLVYCAQLLLDWLARGPWRDPDGHNFPQSIKFNDWAVVPEIISSSGRAHYGIVIAVVVAIALWWLVARTRRGFAIRAVGASPRAASFAGFNHGGTIVLVFVISGACAGLAGVIEVSGNIGHIQPNISPGYGFSAIIVAFLGRLNPLAVIAAGIVLAITYIGGEGAQMMLGISEKIVRIFQGLLLFYVLACNTLIEYQISRNGGAKT